MSEGKEIEFSLRVILDKQKNKVLFAESDSDFADVLLSFLVLPMGTIVRLLVKHYGSEAPILGSFNSLYESVANLGGSHFWTETGKQMLLNPRSSFEDQCRKLKLNIDDASPTKYYICENNTCLPRCVSTYLGSMIKCTKGSSFRLEVSNGGPIIKAGSSDRAFTTQTASFIVTDDMQILPNSTESCMRILNHYGVRDTVRLEERTVVFGLKEIMDLLKGSLVSKSPLTDIILHEISMVSATVNSEPDSLLPQMSKDAASSNSKKMTVKVTLQRSTKRILFAEAGEEYTDFLFSFLTIPLGRVLHLLGSNSSLGSIDNMYNSIEKLNYGRYLNTLDTDNTLLQPQLPPKFLSKIQIFSLTEQSSPESFKFYSPARGITLNFDNAKLVDPKGRGSYVKGPTMFMVTDDLVVTPFSAISSLSILTQKRIPLADVEEQALDIGIEEALSILKASLTSTSALNIALKPFLKSQPKQEK